MAAIFNADNLGARATSAVLIIRMLEFLSAQLICRSKH